MLVQATSPRRSTQCSTIKKSDPQENISPGVVDSNGEDVVTVVVSSPNGVTTVVVFTSSVVMAGPVVVVVTVETAVVVFTATNANVTIFTHKNNFQFLTQLFH
jgi:hypothetical protein